MRLERGVAVILSGAVAKGAFEAGALKVLTRKVADDGGRFVRIVAASSGALNGTLFAAGVHAGDARGAAAGLAELWMRDGGLFHAFHLNLVDLLTLKGISDQRNILDLLSAHVAPRASGQDVDLRIVVASLQGAPGRIGQDPATTYEKVFRFGKSHFESQQALDEVLRAAAASSSFPGAFAPFEPNAGVGPCIDGGAVNNTPIKHALEGGGVDCVVVIGATVEQAPPGSFGQLAGPNLAGHVADVLINERLYRDLHEAEDVNRAMQNLDALALPEETLDRVKAAIGWTGRTIIPIVRIRPLAPLPGNSFSGFVHPSLRKQYVDLGEQRALEVLR